ncbi:MAG: DNA repair protein RecO [Lachnospiraceae bacterium]
MSGYTTVTGIVCSVMTIGDYDKRLVLITKERGRIAVFARGARKTNSPMLAASNPFVFGSFSIYEGRSSNQLHSVEVREYFTELARMQPEVYYGFYFLEAADYYTQEGLDASDTINLLYITLKALTTGKIDAELIFVIYQLRLLQQQGECPQLFECVLSGETQGLTHYSAVQHGVVVAAQLTQVPDARPISVSALYAMQYIVTTPLAKLYSFQVTPEVLHELQRLIHKEFADKLDRKLKSLEILDVMRMP